MINFQELEKVAEFKNGELNWFEGRDINAVYVILVGDEYYIGSSHYTYLRIGQHLNELQKGTHHSEKFQKKFDEIGEFEVYSLDRGIEKSKLQLVEAKYIKEFKPSLNIALTNQKKGMELRIKEILKERNLTQQQFAEMLGITRSALTQQLSGKPSLATIERIAEKLEVPVWQLFTSEEDIIKGVEKKNSIPCPYCGKDIDVSLLKSESDD